jgi:hypothetical protein
METESGTVIEVRTAAGAAEGSETPATAARAESSREEAAVGAASGTASGEVSGKNARPCLPATGL